MSYVIKWVTIVISDYEKWSYMIHENLVEGNLTFDILTLKRLKSSYRHGVYSFLISEFN